MAPYAPPVTDVAGPMGDSYGYWNAWEGGLYDIPWLTNGAYVYSPAFAQLTWPLSLLPWPVWAISWTLASIGLLFWMRVPYLIAFPPVLDDLLRGNVHIFMAAAIVIGMRYSISWAFMFLTKVTPGIGVLWYAARREWRAFGIAVGGTALIVAVSFVIAPDLWRDWIDLLVTNAGASSGVQVIPVPLAARLVIAAVVMVFAASDEPRLAAPGRCDAGDAEHLAINARGAGCMHPAGSGQADRREADLDEDRREDSVAPDLPGGGIRRPVLGECRGEPVRGHPVAARDDLGDRRSASWC